MELPAGTNLVIEEFVYPSITAFIFILTGYKISPKHKFKTAIILFIIYMVTWITIGFIATNKGVAVNFFSSRSILTILGVIAGLLYVKNKNNKSLLIKE